MHLSELDGFGLQSLAGGFVIQIDHLLKTSCRRSFLFCLCDLSWSNLYICRILETSFVNAHVIFQKKRKKFACDFDFSDVLTFGVAVTLYGQTVYMYILVHTLYTILCVYMRLFRSQNTLLCGIKFVYRLFGRVR